MYILNYNFIFAYYALLKLHIRPSVFLNMEREEKAFVTAAIKVKMENDKKQEQEAKRKARRKGR